MPPFQGKRISVRHSRSFVMKERNSSRAMDWKNRKDAGEYIWISRGKMELLRNELRSAVPNFRRC